MSVPRIKQRLESILAYMQPYWELVNCHMVDYLTHKHWDRFVPSQLRAEVAGGKEQVRQCIEAVFWRSSGTSIDSKLFSEFEKYVKLSEEQRLEHFGDVLTELQDLTTILDGMPDGRDTMISIKEFMSEKKRHEVEITAELIDNLIKRLQSKDEDANVFVIDAGDGKGYLSSRLALQYKHKVLGIDCSETNAKNALERSKKLQRAWNTLTTRFKLQQAGINPPRRGSKKIITCSVDCSSNHNFQNYKTALKFITKELDFEQLLHDHYPSELTEPIDKLQFCLTGLHTCGNLAPTCMKVFAAQQQFKVLCNIGCCYHLLTEEFSGSETFGNNSEIGHHIETGFPLSGFLRDKKVCLGRNARMLAAQSIERTVASREVPSISLYYRALLEVLISDSVGIEWKDTSQVGKIRKFTNFREYLEACGRKGKLQLDNISWERVEQLEKQFESDRYYLDLFYLLRMTFAPVLEGLILLDRLLYLQELHYKQSFLLSIFDAVISPRHYCILALKS